MKYIAFFVIIALSIIFVMASTDYAFAHKDGCHSKHSCPSDSGSYTCGDKGYCSECPDNQYCKAGQRSTSSSPKSTTQSSVPNTESKSDCKPNQVCFLKDDYIRYENYLNDKLDSTVTYRYMGMMDYDTIAVHEELQILGDWSTGSGRNPTYLLEVNLCCGIVIDGQYSVLQPSPVKIERWLEHEKVHNIGRTK